MKGFPFETQSCTGNMGCCRSFKRITLHSFLHRKQFHPVTEDVASSKKKKTSYLFPSSRVDSWQLHKWHLLRILYTPCLHLCLGTGSRKGMRTYKMVSFLLVQVVLEWQDSIVWNFQPLWDSSLNTRAKQGIVFQEGLYNLQKVFLQIKYPFCLRSKAHWQARRKELGDCSKWFN